MIPHPSPIPRGAFFTDGAKEDFRVSGGGRHVSYLSSGRLEKEIWVAPRADPCGARRVAVVEAAGFLGYSWAWTDDLLVACWRAATSALVELRRIEVASGRVVSLGTLGLGVACLSESPRLPGEMAILGYREGAAVPDVYRLCCRTGVAERLLENTRGFVDFRCDALLRVALGLRPEGNGIAAYRRHGDLGDWMRVPGPILEPGSQILAVDADGGQAILSGHFGLDTRAVWTLDLDSGELTRVGFHPRADFGGDALVHPATGRLQAVAFTHGRKGWQTVADSVRPDFEALSGAGPGDLSIHGQTADGDIWMASSASDRQPSRFFLYDRTKREIQDLGPSNDLLTGCRLSATRFSAPLSRDGFELLTYYTEPAIPAAETGAPPPAILLIHRGPWTRDSWECSSMHQWLADRGYAVIRVNFRGSTGFGRAFCEAARVEWGHRMEDDLFDALQSFRDGGLVDPDRLGVMGRCYGGFATLTALVQRGHLFRCGVAFGGPLSLLTMMDAVPSSLTEFRELNELYIGDSRSPVGRSRLWNASPLSRVQDLGTPLLIGYGENDTRVEQAEIDALVASMNARRVPVTCLRCREEGAEMERVENRRAFLAIAESFLGLHLGGRAEPIGVDLADSGLRIQSGAEWVPGLSEAEQRRERDAIESHLESVK
jgi:dienelactone hydrolase